MRLRKSAYDDASLARWAERIVAAGKPAYVLCRHTDIPAPWLGVARLQELLGH